MRDVRLTNRAGLAAAAVLVLGYCLCPAPSAARAASAPRDKPPAARPPGPTFAQVYRGYRPDFAVSDRTLARWKAEPWSAPTWPKFSLQKYFNNRAYLEQDWRVPPIIKRADELMARGEYRDAMALYQRVIEKFPEDMWRVARHGVFVPTTLYCQRQLLKLPLKELRYYRTVYDPYAKPLFERARRYYSPLDFAHVAFRYCATSYGAPALYELGNSELDAGNFEKALYYYERIRNYHRHADIDPAELDLRLLVCYRKLGRDADYRRLRKQVEMRPLDAAARRLLAELDAYRPARPPFFSQKASPDALSLSDYTLFEPLVPDLSHYEQTWTVKRDLGYRFPHPNNSVIPSIAGSNLVYKDKNIVYCRSLLTGALKWKYDEGGLVWNFEKMMGGYNVLRCYPYQDLVVHNGIVYTFIFKQGPSLVALDLTTGERLWAAGPMAASSEKELDDRYAARPAVGANRVYATVVHEDVEGDTHLSSTADVAAFEARTGKLLWRRTLCRLTPGKFTISRARRKIRVFCTPPVYQNGVVYVVTNAGVFAALDAETGEVRWVTRYDQNPVLLDALSPAGRRTRFLSNTAPILYGPHMLATAMDNGGRLFCLDRATGRVLWTALMQGRNVPPTTRVIGVWKGQVVLGGMNYIVGIDAMTGRRTFAVNNHTSDSRWGMQVIGRDGKVHSSGYTWNGQFRDTVVDLDKKKLVAERLFWSSYVLSDENPKRIERGLKPLRNTEPYWFAKSRMGFRLWGVPAEIEIDARRINMKYDLARVEAALAKARGFQAMYDRAELHQFADRRLQAIREFEKLRSLLPDEKGRMRIEVNRELFRLYTQQAQAAMRAGDLREVEKYARLMATCPTTSRQEVQAVLSMAEVFERKRQYARAADCLRAVLRHYRAIQYPVSSLVTSKPEPLIRETRATLRYLAAQTPRHFHDAEFRLASAAMLASVPNYFSLIAPVEPDLRVETGQFATDWLLRVLPRTSDAYRRAYERAAAEAFKGRRPAGVLERLIREWPGTAAAQGALDGMIERAQALPVPARNIRLWQLEELAGLNGLSFPRDKRAPRALLHRSAPAPLAGVYRSLVHRFKTDRKTTLRLLTRGGLSRGAEDLLFLGVRSEQRHAVKHGVLCFDAAAGRVRWRKVGIRLKGKGREFGFTEVFVHRGLVVTHGRYDVIAFYLDDGPAGKAGEIAWRYRVPHDFQIEAMTQAGDLFVLSGRFGTLSIHYVDGSLVWEAREQGELYCPPVVAGMTLATVRMNPSGVTFRSLFTGRLKWHLDLPGLLLKRRHPVLPRGREARPVAFGDGLLVLTDGWDYIGIDVARSEIRWRIRVPDVDHSRIPPYRFLVAGRHFFVLKQEYDVTANEMYDAVSGVRLWHNKHPKQVIYSAVAGDGAVYGLNYERDATRIRLRGFDRAKGSPVRGRDYGQYDEPYVFLDPEMHGDAVVAVVRDRENRCELIAIDPKKRRVIHEVKTKGHGLWGNYGEVSYVIQGPTMAILAKDVLHYCRPKGPEGSRR